MASAEWVGMSGRTALVDHSHAVPHLFLVLDGEVSEDGRTYRPGDIRVSGAADRHFLRFVKPSRCLVIELDLLAAPVSRRVLHAPKLHATLSSARAEAEVLDRLERGDFSARYGDLISAPVPDWLEEFEQQRDADTLPRSIRVERLARLAGVTREHLTRSYRRHFGSSVTEALRNRRLRTAYDAMCHSDQPLVEIAVACGFADQSHMTRQFAEWIGLTPGLVRAQARVTSVQDEPQADVAHC